MKKIFITITVLLALVSSSCEDFLTVNETNPNSASAVPANLILPAALNSTANIHNRPFNFFFVYAWHGCFAVAGNYVANTTLTQYNLLNSSYQGNWANIYLNLQNYDYLDKISSDPKDSYFAAIAKIMKAYQYQTLVDVWGNVPYSEALKTGEGILKPKYDDAKTIYEDLVLTLDEAMNLIANAPLDANIVGDDDIMFAGNMKLWWKFANTLKLRMLINQSGMTGRDQYIKTAIATQPHTVNDYLGVGESALVNPGYVKSEGKMNPFWETFYKQDDSRQADGLNYFCANQDAVDFLTGNFDPRAERFFAPIPSGVIRGTYYGEPIIPSVTSELGTGLVRSYNQDAIIMTDFESLFLQAEAVQRGLLTGNTKALYESAVTRSIIYMGGLKGNAAAAATYLADDTKPLVNFDAAPNKLQTILTQKWLSLIGISPVPLWTDYRRTGYPGFIHWSQEPNKKNATPPVRLLYPQTEINVNNDNVLAVGTINPFTSKIFWQNR
ncbi:MAG TPA: SusD/RagB family nutrient-binding outer membrane lipoprotein [Bacteroidales bacterium]|nr:SusD/RagB family nutrient-binding outer membrane lipoprotein [Bacteroidales bacterium]